MCPNARSPDETYWLATSIAVLGGGLLIYWLAAARPLWVDEEMLALNVRDRTFGQLAGSLWLNQSAPFGWLVLERLLMLTLGTSERAVRLLTVCFGISTLATATWIGRRWMTPFGAAILVSMCAFGEWLVFFVLELKHYSGDTFWALLLPALAASSLDDRAGSTSRARTTVAWWLAAAFGLWFGNGAVFVTPGCAVVLVIVSWRRGGWRGASSAAAPGVVWLASFAADYVLVLRHALANPVLDEYWAFAFPRWATASWRRLAGLRVCRNRSPGNLRAVNSRFSSGWRARPGSVSRSRGVCCSVSCSPPCRSPRWCSRFCTSCPSSNGSRFGSFLRCTSRSRCAPDASVWLRSGRQRFIASTAAVLAGITALAVAARHRLARC